jgi:hypothetical protein
MAAATMARRFPFISTSVGPAISGFPAHGAESGEQGFEFSGLFLVRDFNRLPDHALQKLYLIAIEFYKVAFHDEVFSTIHSHEY